VLAVAGRLAGVGYGAFKVNGKVVDAHRFAYELRHGAAPLPGIWICHKCDNRKCCNPSHLVAGTPGDNYDDMVKRGSHNHPPRASAALRAKRDAEGLPGQKLDREKVERIRREWATGGHSFSSMAAMFGVHRMTISRIVRGERWIDEMREKKSA
jgi:hypothetical protein